MTDSSGSVLSTMSLLWNELANHSSQCVCVIAKHCVHCVCVCVCDKATEFTE